MKKGKLKNKCFCCPLENEMKLILDEEEIWTIECIKEAHIDCGFHIRDVIKKQKQSMDSPDQQYMKS